VFRQEPGDMTGADATAAGLGSAPPVGTTFTASANGATSPNAFHFTSSGNVQSVSFILSCIPD
jgi:hypothetical protein